jgi:hypothetical protein
MSAGTLAKLNFKLSGAVGVAPTLTTSEEEFTAVASHELDTETNLKALFARISPAKLTVTE